MVERISFYDQIARNKRKSFFLIVIIFLVFLLLGYLISKALDPSFFFIIMIFSIFISISYILISYYKADSLALMSVGAQPASRTNHKMFFDSVESMSLASGLPMPRLYIMQSAQINAFASGRDPKNSVICVTTGTLEKLNKQELEGVIAHEMSHIANYDIRFMTLTAVMIGLISIMTEIFLRSLWFSSSGEDREGKKGIVLLVAAIIVAILAPILTQLISLAISRKREYLADATGVKLTRSPTGLTSALKKIKSESSLPEQERKRYPKEVAPLFISDPFKRKFESIFATHPPIEKRIEILERM